MIYVAVGTQKFQFNRLLESIDQLIECGMISEEVFAQRGHSDYVPRNYSYKDFLSKDEFDSYVQNCDLLITHSGVATIMAGLKHEKPVIVIPRLAKYNEHVDDHQVQIAESFAAQNFVMLCEEKDDLGRIIKDVRKHEFSKYMSRRELVTRTIKDYLLNIGTSGE